MTFLVIIPIPNSTSNLDLSHLHLSFYADLAPDSTLGGLSAGWGLMLCRPVHPPLRVSRTTRLVFSSLIPTVQVPLPARIRSQSWHNVVQRTPHAQMRESHTADVILFSEAGSKQRRQNEPTRQADITKSKGSGDNNAGLPVTCPGCGALTQRVDAAQPGFYTRSRKTVRAYLKSGASDDAETKPDVEEPLAESVPSGDATEQKPLIPSSTIVVPLCDRCHDLRHDSKGIPIAHPSLQNIADSLAESPFQRNHVYHVLDAVDFPMSLEPRIFSFLRLARIRSQNRRAKTKYPYKPTLSFIITRSDLLGPTKEKVDGLMSYFQNVLRTALGRRGAKMRLGNVHLLSAKRGWWTSDIKEDIWKRGGGNWLVGKFNVGKSNLFEVLFPKGSGDRAPVYAEPAREQELSQRTKTTEVDEDSMLPPPQPESPFPTMPLVSNLPGTTASPIRLPFGNNKGELIDLPGLARGNLSNYVADKHKLDIIMTSKPKVAGYTIKPGQSLLLGGGLIRITPFLDPDDRSTTVTAYPFVPIEPHVTSTEKAIGEQAQTRESGISTILAEGVGDRFRSAGIFKLNSDVTKKHAGSVVRAGVDVNKLPFRVYSTDLLIQGVGWVELVCQVRRRRLESQMRLPPTSAIEQPLDAFAELQAVQSTGPASIFDIVFPPPEKPSRSRNPKGSAPESVFPCVEVFTPNGQHISSRPSMGAWMLWREGNPKLKRMRESVRPRRSMKGDKRREKEKAGGEGGGR
jgi:genetic interactor of prohibitins 3, mitochondrial